jgi:hypothetical protein
VKVTPEEAREILSKVASKHHFKLHLGTDITNLHELEEAVDIISADSLKHHIGDKKNDFSSWVRECVGDDHLARELKDKKTKKAIKGALIKRISYLEKKAAEGKPISAKEWMMYGQVDFMLGLIVGFVVGIVISILL